MPLSPYISFAGNCAEATAFYQQAVGAELSIKSPSAKCQKR
jgi:PhnB protein